MAVPRRSLLLGLAALAVALRAAEPPPAAPAPAEDSIATARRDYDAIKQARSPAEQARLEVPAVSAPTLHLSNDEMAAFMEAQAAEKKREREKAGKAKKSSNWLVDAMSEPSPDAKETAGSPAVTATAPTSLDLLAADRGETARAEAKRGEGPAKASAPDNPLTSFMSDWMTSRDFDLLKVRPAGEAAGPAADRGPVPAPGLDSLLRGDTGPEPGARGLASGSGPAPRGNPYLAPEAETPGAVGLTNLDSFSPPAASLPSFAPAAPAPPPPAPRVDPPPAKNDAPVNDLLKPSGDDKYFPQLKRF